MESDWERVDLPVLRAAVDLLERGATRPLRVDGLAATTGLEEADVKAALERLRTASPPYLAGKSGWGEGGGYPLVTGVTEHGRRELGQ